MYHAPRGKGFFLPWLTFHFWVGKRGFFWLRVCLAKKNGIFGSCLMFLRLGDGRLVLRLGIGVRLGMGSYA